MMWTAKSRLKSKNWVDKAYGILFYVSSLALLSIPVYIGFNTELLNAKTGILFILFSVFLTVAMQSFRDYKKINKIHSGTLEYFIATINPRHENFIQRLFFNGKMKCFYAIMSGLSGFFGLVCVFYKQSHPFSSNFECFYLFILIMFITFLVFLSEKINFIDVNKHKVDAKNLFAINTLEDLNENQKVKIRKEIASDIHCSGFVTRRDLRYIYTSMIDSVNHKKELELKRKEIEEYNKFTQNN